MERSPIPWPRPTSAVLALALLLPACVGRGTYSEVVRERDRLSLELERARKTNEALGAERVELLDEMEDLRQEREELDSSVRELRETKEALTESLELTTQELQERTREIQNLRSTYDSLVQELEAEVAAGEIQIEQLREGLRLNVAQDILFASGSTKLEPSGQRVLRKVAAQLVDLPHHVEVQGHTDNVPVRASSRFPSNWELAAERAAQVVRLFVAEGVGPERLRAVSYGEHHPVASNETPEGRLRNRRIEIRLEPVQAPASPSADPGA